MLVREDTKILFFLFALILFSAPGKGSEDTVWFALIQEKIMYMFEKYLLYESNSNHVTSAIKLGLTVEIMYKLFEI